MAFALDDFWVWDFWTARDGADFHLFFLQAPKALGDPELRHWNVSIGHAVSTDLRRWTMLGTCFGPSEGPAWDDGTTWTGSVLRHGDRWHLFYTGTAKAEDCRKQRIGVAVSSDLHHWERRGDGPVIDLDERWYEEYGPGSWHDRSLRDPWVVPDPTGHGFRMWFTARTLEGPADGRGVVGTARSDDLFNWIVEPPVTEPGAFGEVEVPQYLAAGGRSYLTFCSSIRRTSEVRRARLAARGRAPETGTHYFVADRPEGPYRLAPGPFLTAALPFTLYAGRIVEGPDGRLNLLGFVLETAEGAFGGTISDPLPIHATADGRLVIDAGAANAAA